MRALVISGGGSKGAFAGGFAQYMIHERKVNYDIFVGTSTGSLLVPHLAIDKIDKLYEIYTSVKQSDIYNISPFKIKELPDGSIASKINHYNTLRMFLRRKKTFGETKNLRRTLEKILTQSDFEQLQKSGKYVIATVANLTKNRIEYKFARDCSYEDFLDWMWASASFVPFMSVVEKDGFEYADGGFGNYIPVEQAVDLGATMIDVVVLIPRQKAVHHLPTKNAFDVLMRSMGFMLDQIAYDDIYIGHLQSIYNEKVKIHFHFTPELLTHHSFYFNPVLMKRWWHEGFEFAKKRAGELPSWT